VTTVRSWLLLTCLLLASEAGASSLLRELHHSVSSERTRLSLEVSGEITYAAREQGGRLMVRFPDMKLAEGLVAGRRYREGLIESVQFVRPESDTVAMILSFRPGAAYRIVRPETGGSLEIHAEGPPYVPPYQPPPPVRSARAATAPGPKAEGPAPPPIGRLIDIAALAREQASDATPGHAREAAPSATPREAEHSASPVPLQAGASALGWVLAFIISLATTSVMLLLIARRRSSPVIPRAGGSLEAAPATENLFSRNLVEAMASSDDATDEEDDAVEQEASGAGWFAERFERGAEEVDLAFRLRGAGAAETKARIAQELSSRPIPASRLAQTARRGGVGIGEMELARNLRNLAASQQRKENLP
jgi:hypothetical protein